MILDCENVDDFLQHRNNQKPAIRFVMETENDNIFAFLDTTVSRELDGRLTTSVYRKPKHTDQYLVMFHTTLNQYALVLSRRLCYAVDPRLKQMA